MQLDDIPIQNKARDKAWEAFIKRKDVKQYFQQQNEGFRFPLERGWYELWCQCWHRAYEEGFKDARERD